MFVQHQGKWNYSSLKPLTCNILICFTMVLLPDSPAPAINENQLNIYINKLIIKMIINQKNKKNNMMSILMERYLYYLIIVADEWPDIFVYLFVFASRYVCWPPSGVCLLRHRFSNLSDQNSPLHLPEDLVADSVPIPIPACFRLPAQSSIREKKRFMVWVLTRWCFL